MFEKRLKHVDVVFVSHIDPGNKSHGNSSRWIMVVTEIGTLAKNPLIHKQEYVSYFEIYYMRNICGCISSFVTKVDKVVENICCFLWEIVDKNRLTLGIHLFSLPGLELLDRLPNLNKNGFYSSYICVS